jgi:hypothetical protein
MAKQVLPAKPWNAGISFQNVMNCPLGRINR